MPDFEPVDFDPFKTGPHPVFPAFDAQAVANPIGPPDSDSYFLAPSNVSQAPALTRLVDAYTVGVDGQPRMQAWPERLVRNALRPTQETLAGRNPMDDYLLRNRDQLHEPNMLGRLLGMTQPWYAPGGESTVSGMVDAASLAGGAPLIEGAGTGTLGSGAMRPGAKPMPAEPTVVQPFYSAMEHAVRSAKQDVMSPDQWRGYLQNMPGVKAEELEWTGVPEGKKITKQQMLDHVQEHGVQVKEVEKGGASGMNEDTAREVAYERVLRQNGYNPLSEATAGEREIPDFWDHVEDHAAQLMDDQEHGPRYGKQQLPGGENYREKLFTLPQKNALRVEPITANSYRLVDTNTGEMIAHGTPEAMQARLREMQPWEAGVRGRNGQGPYQSSHWDEPNVLAHVRMNDREIPGDVGRALRIEPYGNKFIVQGFGVKDADPAMQFKFSSHDAAQQYIDTNYPNGAPLNTLHLEELQSDWHQTGRKQGYKQGNLGPTEAQTTEVATILDGLRGHEPRFGGTIENNGSGWSIKGAAPSWLEKGWITPEELTKLQKYEEARSADIQDRHGGVPDAPFKTTWPDMILKRMIRQAADEGYDAISWTPGEAQAARYDLSKQVDGIKAVRRSDGTYDLVAQRKGDKDFLTPVASKIPETKLADHVGKDLAEKIKDQVINTKEYTGLDLKVGGEGMKGFYDKILVDKVNAIAKKFGGKVEWKEIHGDPQQMEVIPWPSRHGNPDEFHVYDSHEQHLETFSSQEAADQFVKQGGKAHKIPVLRLTPQLRDVAQRRGFPLFAAGVPFPLEPVDHDPFAGNKKGTTDGK